MKKLHMLLVLVACQHAAPVTPAPTHPATKTPTTTSSSDDNDDEVNHPIEPLPSERPSNDLPPEIVAMVERELVFYTAIADAIDGAKDCDDMVVRLDAVDATEVEEIRHVNDPDAAKYRDAILSRYRERLGALGNRIAGVTRCTDARGMKEAVHRLGLDEAY